MIVIPYGDYFLKLLIDYPWIHGLTIFFFLLIQYRMGLAYVRKVYGIRESPFMIESITQEQPPSDHEFSIRLKPSALLQAVAWGVLVTLTGFLINYSLEKLPRSELVVTVHQGLHGILFGAIIGSMLPNIGVTWSNLRILHFVEHHPQEIKGKIQYSELATIFGYRNSIFLSLFILLPLTLVTMNSVLIGATLGVLLYVLDLTIDVHKKSRIAKQSSSQNLSTSQDSSTSHDQLSESTGETKGETKRRNNGDNTSDSEP